MRQAITHIRRSASTEFPSGDPSLTFEELLDGLADDLELANDGILSSRLRGHELLVGFVQGARMGDYEIVRRQP